MNTQRSAAFVLVASMICGSTARASDDELAELDFSSLQHIKVTSASKREQKLSDAAAAISVLSGYDLRRAGVTTLPEALRLVPGMNVARIDSHSYALSARG